MDTAPKTERCSSLNVSIISNRLKQQLKKNLEIYEVQLETALTTNRNNSVIGLKYKKKELASYPHQLLTNLSKIINIGTM
jgi:hypothetical protein